MSREGRYRLTLRAYPRAYREARGDELLATLLEASEFWGSWGALAETADLVANGLRLRLGLTSRRYAGRVLALAASPAFMVAAALSIIAFVFGEVVPRAPSYPANYPAVDLHQFRLGPFATVGPIVYGVWVLGALCLLVRPGWRRPLAATCSAVTLLTPIVADTAWRPPILFLLVLAGLGAPAILAPLPERAAEGRAAGAATGAFTLVVVAGFELATVSLGSFQLSDEIFYQTGLHSLANLVPIVVGAGLIVIVGAAVFRRSDLAGAVAALLVPFTTYGALMRRYPWAWPYLAWNSSNMSRAEVFRMANAALLGILLTWLAAWWVVDHYRSTTSLGEA